MDVLLNAGGQALPDLQAELALLNTCRFIVKGLSTMKSYLFVLRHAAHSGIYVQEMLDIILTTAAFDQAVSLLLLDDGVFQLKKHQQPEQYGMKDTAAIFNALEIYDIHAIYSETESLQSRGLTANDLCLPIREYHRKDISALMAQFDVVFAG